MNSILICPICSETLVCECRNYKCINNHNYDLAKEGYLNLLLVNQKSSKTPGDNKEMIDARRSFLEKGIYSPLSDKINQIAEKYLRENRLAKILDCGCGEGYYSNRLNNYLKEKGIKTESYGMDISKFAISLAAKKYKDICFIVGNISYKFPFADNSFDLIVNIFAPRNSSEFKRVLKKDGVVIVAFPDKNHLQGLKDKLGIKVSHEDKPEDIIKVFVSFELVDSQKVEQKITLDKESALSLIKMTPMYYWHIDPQKLDSLDQITTEISFNIFVFRNNIRRSN